MPVCIAGSGITVREILKDQGLDENLTFGAQRKGKPSELDTMDRTGPLSFQIFAIIFALLFGILATIWGMR